MILHCAKCPLNQYLCFVVTLLREGTTGPQANRVGQPYLAFSSEGRVTPQGDHKSIRRLNQFVGDQARSLWYRPISQLLVCLLATTGGKYEEGRLRARVGSDVPAGATRSRLAAGARPMDMPSWSALERLLPTKHVQEFHFRAHQLQVGKMLLPEEAGVGQ